MKVILKKNQSPFAQIILEVIKLGLDYLAFSVLTGAILISFVYFFIFLINISEGNPNLGNYATILNLLGVPETGKIEGGDLINIYLKATFPIYLLGIFIKTFTRNIFKRKYCINNFKLGIIVLTALMIIAQISTFLPSAANGAESIRVILIIFWLVSLMSLTAYSLISNYSHFISKLS